MARPRKNGLPADRFNLTEEERSTLPDPNWLTEDDADAIIAMRREREAGKNVSLGQVLRESGVKSRTNIPHIAAATAKPRKSPRAVKK